MTNTLKAMYEHANSSVIANYFLRASLLKLYNKNTVIKDLVQAIAKKAQALL